MSVSEQPQPAAELTLRGITLDVAGCCVRVQGHLVPLAPMELTVLKVLMENAGALRCTSYGCDERSKWTLTRRH